MSLAYIAAPYGAGTVAEIRRNALRAAALGRLASMYSGVSAVVVHAGIASVFGDDDDPEARENGLEANLELVSVLAFSRAELWVLLRDDGSVSDGVRQEVDAFHLAGGLLYHFGTWQSFTRTAARIGVELDELFDQVERDHSKIWGKP